MSKWLYRFKLMLAHKDALRTRIPFLYNRNIQLAQKRASRAAKSLSGKSTINVAFMLTIPGMWKLDYLFQFMQHDKRYHPYIVIYPYSTYKGFLDKTIWETIQRTEDFVKQRGYEYIIPYDKKTNKWLDIKHIQEPDIVFFTTPYRDVLPQYYYYHFKDKLTCYVSYAYDTMNAYKLGYDQIAHNLYGLVFAETDIHLDYAKKYGRSHGINYRVTGYPGTEVYLHTDYASPDVWKPQNKQKKRVIWAPHHTIDGSDDFQSSTFLDYCQTMLSLAQKYKDDIQIAFKPHQLLKFKLIQLWGEKKTNAYYQQWADMDNTQLEEADYRDLFIHSDAMIHDCGSFTVEYLYVNKPVMYLIKDNQQPNKLFNTFGELAFEQHYHAYKQEDIEQFLKNVVINGNDTLSASRQDFHNKWLAPIDGKMPSEQIIYHINKMINNQESNQ